MKLLEWQEKVVHGTEWSLAVPAGARTGKNVATVFAMKKKHTLAVVPNLTHRRCLERDIKNRAGCLNIADVITVREFFEGKEYLKGYVANYEQIIFNELFDIKLIDLLQFRDRFNGRIVVIGTPLGIPCPIFYPLSKMKGWAFLHVNEYETAVNKEYFDYLRKTQPFPVFRTNFDGAFV